MAPAWILLSGESVKKLSFQVAQMGSLTHLLCCCCSKGKLFCHTADFSEMYRNVDTGSAEMGILSKEVEVPGKRLSRPKPVGFVPAQIAGEVNSICRILGQSSWSPRVEECLMKLGFKLTPYHVVQVMRQLADNKLALQFFILVGQSEECRHDATVWSMLLSAHLIK